MKRNGGLIFNSQVSMLNLQLRNFLMNSIKLKEYEVQTQWNEIATKMMKGEQICSLSQTSRTRSVPPCIPTTAPDIIHSGSSGGLPMTSVNRSINSKDLLQQLFALKDAQTNQVDAS
ncbi:unnamed protein product [Camellia sinensis]